MITFSVILPAFREAENLKIILPKLKSILQNIGESFEILVVDTEETDPETLEVCKSENVIHINRNGGNRYGDAIRTGISLSKGEYVIMMDADGSHEPECIVQFYNEILSGYDLIIGSRYCKGGKTDNSFILKMMSWILNITYRLMFGLHVKDVSDSFRMYKGEQIRNISIECKDFDVVEEILIVLNYTIENFSVKEIPISFNKRLLGESKRNLFVFVISYIKTMNRLMKIKRKHLKTGG